MECLKKLNKVLKFINGETMSLTQMKNRRKVIEDFAMRRATVRGYPFVLHIEVTNRCNLDCKMCPRTYMCREEGFMEFSLFKKIIDEAKGKVEYVELYLFGEPLLHPQIVEMIDYCKDADMCVSLSTNATLLTKKKSHSLLNSEIDFFTLSLDAISKQIYESIRVKANFKKVMDNVAYFLNIRQPKSPRHTIVQLIKMKDNADEVDRFIDVWSNSGIQIHLKNLITWRGDIESINVHEQNQHKLSDVPNEPCDRIWRHFTVFWDGAVVPCHFMYDKKYTVGNIQDKSLHELWNNSKFVDFRKQHILCERRNIPACKKCTVKSLHGWELLVAILLNTYALRSINTILHYN